MIYGSSTSKPKNGRKFKLIRKLLSLVAEDFILLVWLEINFLLLLAVTPNIGVSAISTLLISRISSRGGKLKDIHGKDGKIQAFWDGDIHHQFMMVKSTSLVVDSATISMISSFLILKCKISEHWKLRLKVCLYQEGNQQHVLWEVASSCLVASTTSTTMICIHWMWLRVNLNLSRSWKGQGRVCSRWWRILNLEKYSSKLLMIRV